VSSVHETKLSLRLLEQARGSIWSQLLHQRELDPLFLPVPSTRSQELYKLLHKISKYRSPWSAFHSCDINMMSYFLHDRGVQQIEYAHSP
jgi:hypothetical protein